MAQDESSEVPPELQTTSPEELIVPLRFVNLDRSNLGRDAGTKKLVRSHVMQRYRRDKAAKTLKGLPPFTSVPSKRGRASGKPVEILKDILGRLRQVQYVCTCPNHPVARRWSVGDASTGGNVTTTPDGPVSTGLYCQECNGEIEASSNEQRTSRIVVGSPPTSLLGAGRSDPFYTLPLQDQTKSFYLLDHYSQVILGLDVPMNDSQLRWFRQALSDEVLLHSLLLYAAKHNEILTGSSGEVEIYGHRGEVMRIINDRIRNGREKLVDTTIDAVACLVLFEEMFGTSESAKAHRAGLSQLVTLRGGLDSLGLDSPLYKLVIWASKEPSILPIWEMVDYKSLPINISCTFQQSPQASISTSSQNYRERLSYPSLNLQSYATIPCTPFDLLPPPKTELLTRLRNSTLLISSLLHRTCTPTSTYRMPSSIAALATHLETKEQYVLKARLAEELCFQQSLPRSQGRTAWLIAAVLYASKILSYSLCTSHNQYTVVQHLVAALRAALITECDAFATSESLVSLRYGIREDRTDKIRYRVSGFEPEPYAPNVMLWMLFVGGACSDCIGIVEAEWFANAMRELSCVLGLKMWSDVKRRLREFPWSEQLVERPWRRFWGRSVEEFSVT